MSLLDIGPNDEWSSTSFFCDESSFFDDLSGYTDATDDKVLLAFYSDMDGSPSVSRDGIIFVKYVVVRLTDDIIYLVSLIYAISPSTFLLGVV